MAWLAAAPVQAQTGAQVNEGAASATLYVDQSDPDASDANPGTAAKPLRKISAALNIAFENNRRGQGTRIIIGPGTYRERLGLNDNLRPGSAPLILEAREAGRTVISGSDVYRNWRSEGGGVYSHSWTNNWGLSRDPWASQAEPLTDLARRRELVFVNGKLMRQYLTKSEMQNRSGSYYVDEGSNRLYVHTQGSINLANVGAEVGAQETLLSIRDQQNVVLRGLVFEHAVSEVGNAAVFVGTSRDVVIDRCVFQWNNWNGLRIANSEDVTIRRSRANYNGVMGIGGSKNKNMFVEDVEANHNNEWRGGGWGGKTQAWSIAGIKLLGIHGGTFRNLEVSNNLTVGFWLDYNNRDITIDGLTSCGNREHGLFVEASQGPVTVRNSIVCDNGTHPESLSKGGVRFTNLRGLRFERNIVYGNGQAQLWSPNRSESNRKRCVEDWETGREDCMTSAGWVFRNNVFASTHASQALADVPFAPPPSQKIDDIDSERNLWYHPNGQGTFKDATKDQASFRDWKARWKADGNSPFEDPDFTDPGALNFTLRAGSPVRGWGLPVGPGRRSDPDPVEEPEPEEPVEEPADEPEEEPVEDPTPSKPKEPKLAIVSPQDGAVFPAGASITMKVKAEDEDGRIVSVKLYLGSEELIEETQAPYTFSWPNVPAGEYHVTVKAKDNDGLTSTAQTTLYVGSAAPVQDDDEVTPALWLKFDDAGSSFARDASGIGNSGKLQGAPKWSNGKFGSAISLDGTKDYVEVKHDASLEMDQTVTVMGWFKNTTGDGNPNTGVSKRTSYRLLARSAKAHRSNWAFDLWDTEDNFYRVETVEPIANGAWHHIAATYDGSQMKIYVDGELAGSKEASGLIRPSGWPLEVGRRDGSYYFGGLIDEVRIYAKALSPNEIRQAVAGGAVTAAATSAALHLEEVARVAEEEATDDLPGGYRLGTAYPNPFNPQTQFTLEVSQAQQVRVEVYDLLGRRVALLHDGTLSAGQAHAFTFEASRLPSGTYVLRASGETFQQTQTLVLLK